MTLTLLDPSPEEPDDDGLLTVPDGFPALPAAAVYHGLAGQIIDAIAPHTEVDPVAILTQLLVAFGAAVGRGAYFQVEATRHHPNEFLVLVGDSAKARKGSSWDHVRRLLDHADPTLATRTLTGLSSGEGLIWAVRDPTPTDPGGGLRLTSLGVPCQLAEQPRLADPRLAHQLHENRLTSTSSLQRLRQSRQLALASNHRRAVHRDR